MTDLNQLITTNPKIHQGVPIVAGTGVTVRRIAYLYNTGKTVRDIVWQIPHLPPEGVHAAIAYYLLNKEEIDQDMEAQQQVPSL